MIDFLKKITKKTFLFKLVNIYRINKIILKKYGYFNSLKYKLPIDKNKKPIPWYTYPAIEYLHKFDLKNKAVFEYGTGNSSLFFADKAKEVFCVENDEGWFEKINKDKPKNLNILFKKNKDDYLFSIDNLNKKFDIIVIDASYRFECCFHIKNNLKEGGIVILDNSDWHNDCIGYLKKELNLIQVDFSGLGPINGYTWVTSIFFSRDFDFLIENDK